MSVTELLTLLKSDPSAIQFKQVIELIEESYDYMPTRFVNGSVVNEAGTNEGSCKIFAFAELNGLSEPETLALFGHYYRDDVLGNPDGSDHGNIRNFMISGWSGVKFDSKALLEK